MSSSHTSLISIIIYINNLYINDNTDGFRSQSPTLTLLQAPQGTLYFKLQGVLTE
jgi:hypothetical protein